MALTVFTDGRPVEALPIYLFCLLGSTTHPVVFNEAESHDHHYHGGVLA